MPKRSVPKSRRPAEKPEPARREEVLEAALALVAERGVAGASLRALAKQLGISQPSLYHYFSSKDELVSQIVDYCTNKMIQIEPPERPLSVVEELPRFVADTVTALWSTERHPRFVRFLFVAAMESTEHRAVIRRTFEERLYPAFSVMASAFARDDRERRELQGIIWMIVYSLGLAYMERRALFFSTADDPDLLDQVEWITRAGESLVRERVLACRER
ncbi:MAG TPA: TetR/AcrR family transcriptional regulator [Polyangiaceae bacterium]|nr:TetR/AcrR family transcriptional regulator [Polyangiaceae bacterium]HMR76708.1 TetR/AcrR family transcriptional regulator [Polyangiaceae bacterium]